MDLEEGQTVKLCPFSHAKSTEMRMDMPAVPSTMEPCFNKPVTVCKIKRKDRFTIEEDGGRFVFHIDWIESVMGTNMPKMPHKIMKMI